jgi:hypothetical protein
VSHSRSDWLDAVARRLAVGRTPTTHQPGPVSYAANEDRFSRAAAVRLAVAGVASLFLGLRTTSKASGAADGYAECYAGCTKTYEDALEDALDGCARVSAGLDKKSPAWATAIRSLPVTPLTFVGYALTGTCYADAAAILGGDLYKCRRGCKKNCRTTQAASEARSTCEVTPPPKNYTPAQPPPPNMTSDPCWSCVAVGGMCCGPFTVDASGNFQACVCANPTLGCEKYGCK